MVRILEPPSPSKDSPEDPSRPRAAGGVGLNRSQRLGLAALAGTLLLVCGLWLLRAGGEPLQAARDADDGPAYRLDVNQADWAVLSLVPGLGKTLSGRIVAYRQAHGPFTSLEELAGVRGIGRIKLGEIREFLTVGRSGPPAADVPGQ